MLQSDYQAAFSQTAVVRRWRVAWKQTRHPEERFCDEGSLNATLCNHHLRILRSFVAKSAPQDDERSLNLSFETISEGEGGS